MLKTILSGLLITAFFLPTVTALDWRVVCNDSENLHRYMEFTSCNATACETYNISQYTNCTFGCDNVTNQCAPDPVNLNLWFGFGILGLLMAIGVIGRLVKWW